MIWKKFIVKFNNTEASLKNRQYITLYLTSSSPIVCSIYCIIFSFPFYESHEQSTKWQVLFVFNLCHAVTYCCVLQPAFRCLKMNWKRWKYLNLCNNLNHSATTAGIFFQIFYFIFYDSIKSSNHMKRKNKNVWKGKKILIRFYFRKHQKLVKIHNTL